MVHHIMTVGLVISTINLSNGLVCVFVYVVEIYPFVHGGTTVIECLHHGSLLITYFGTSLFYDEARTILIHFRTADWTSTGTIY